MALNMTRRPGPDCTGAYPLPAPREVRGDSPAPELGRDGSNVGRLLPRAANPQSDGPFLGLMMPLGPTSLTGHNSAKWSQNLLVTAA